MNIKNINEDNFEILRRINKNPSYTQRELARKIGISLGKLNYCLKALKDKGLLKMKNFKSRDNKISHLRYILTPQGVALRTKLTINFMEKKIKEYEELKRELYQ